MVLWIVKGEAPGSNAGKNSRKTVGSLIFKERDLSWCWKRDFVVSSYVDLRSSTVPVTSAKSLSGGAMMIAAMFTCVQT